MTQRRNPLTATMLLMIVMKAFSGHTLTCHPAEYQIDNECCPMCPAGSRVKTHCTEFRSTSCLPCLDGTYRDKLSGLKQCVPCTNCDSGSGLKVKRSCTASSDTVCETQEGFYCIDFTGDSCEAAQKHKSCQSGQYISQIGTAFTDTVCSDCSDGTFSEGTSTSCQPHTHCESKNLQLIKAGTASTDAECGAQSSNVAIIVTIPVMLFLLISLCGLVFYFVKKRKVCQKGGQRNASASSRGKPDGTDTSLVMSPGPRDG